MFPLCMSILLTFRLFLFPFKNIYSAFKKKLYFIAFFPIVRARAVNFDGLLAAVANVT